MKKPLTTQVITDKKIRAQKFAKLLTQGSKIKQAYKDTHDTSNYTSEQAVQVEAGKYLRKPLVQNELAIYTDLSETVLVSTMADYGLSERPREREIAVDVAKFVHDKVHGKAKQSVEVQSTTVNLHLDLTADSPVVELPTDDAA